MGVKIYFITLGKVSYISMRFLMSESTVRFSIHRYIYINVILKYIFFCLCENVLSLRIETQLKAVYIM